jgi:hypothetical protein
MIFTFIYGTATSGREDLVMDLEAPLNEATLALFYHNDLINYDLPKMHRDYLPYGDTRIGDFIDSLKHNLRNQFGQDILGQIALKNFRDMRYDDLFRQVIFEHCDSVADIKVFEYMYPNAEFYYDKALV